MNTNIALSDCYALHIHITKVLDTTARHLEITSTFTGAKDPQDERRLFDVTLSESQYQQLANAIQEGA